MRSPRRMYGKTMYLYVKITTYVWNNCLTHVCKMSLNKMLSIYCYVIYRLFYLGGITLANSRLYHSLRPCSYEFSHTAMGLCVMKMPSRVRRPHTRITDHYSIRPYRPARAAEWAAAAGCLWRAEQCDGLDQNFVISAHAHGHNASFRCKNQRGQNF